MTILEKLWQAVIDRFKVLQLRAEVYDLKARRYDHLAENVLGLRRALETQERAAGDLHKQLDEREERIDKLKDEYAALEERRVAAREAVIRAERQAVFKRLQPVITQLPTMRAAVEQGADIDAQDVLDLLSPLHEALGDLGFDPIGEAGAEVPYDPTRHTPVGRGARAITPDDTVRIRYVGYMHDDEVVCKAQVTRVQQEALS